MAEPFLIDLEGGLDDKGNHQLTQNNDNVAGKMSIGTDHTGTTLLSGFNIKVVEDVPTRSSCHFEGIRVGIDKTNNRFIISQQPQVPETSTYLRLSISLDEINIINNQERVISTKACHKNDITTLFIKALTAFKPEIIYASQNKQQQSQDQGLIDLMCSLSGADLSQGTIIEITEVDRDIWGENNQLVKLLKKLGSEEGVEDQQESDSKNEVTASSSINDIWKGLESLGFDSGVFPVSDKILDLGEPLPWYKPEFVKPQLPTRDENSSRSRDYNSHQSDKPISTSSASNGPHRRYMSEISSMPQLPEPVVDQRQSPNDRLTTDIRSQSCQSSESQQVSMSSLEGQMEEQSLKNLETNCKSFWESQEDKVGRQYYREPKTKFAATQIPGISAPEEGSAAKNHTSSDLTGWKNFATRNGGEIRNDQCRDGSFQLYGVSNGAGTRGRGGGGVGMAGRGAARGYIRATRSDNHSPFPPPRGKQQGPPKACYNNRTPFGGWDHAKARRRVQSEEVYEGESSISFQRGMY